MMISLLLALVFCLVCGVLLIMKQRRVLSNTDLEKLGADTQFGRELSRAGFILLIPLAGIISTIATEVWFHELPRFLKEGTGLVVIYCYWLAVRAVGRASKAYYTPDEARKFTEGKILVMGGIPFILLFTVLFTNASPRSFVPVLVYGWFMVYHFRQLARRNWNFAPVVAAVGWFVLTVMQAITACFTLPVTVDRTLFFGIIVATFIATVNTEHRPAKVQTAS